ncbi:unnamed protein product [Dicrocoelium dendriticum]|nr:unnamed protein product [Dicrocoelium dendriticum]
MRVPVASGVELPAQVESNGPPDRVGGENDTDECKITEHWFPSRFSALGESVGEVRDSGGGGSGGGGGGWGGGGGGEGEGGEGSEPRNRMCGDPPWCRVLRSPSPSHMWTWMLCRGKWDDEKKIELAREWRALAASQRASGRSFEFDPHVSVSLAAAFSFCFSRGRPKACKQPKLSAMSVVFRLFAD